MRLILGSGGQQTATGSGPPGMEGFRACFVEGLGFRV